MGGEGEGREGRPQFIFLATPRVPGLYMEVGRGLVGLIGLYNHVGQINSLQKVKEGTGFKIACVS